MGEAGGIWVEVGSDSSKTPIRAEDGSLCQKEKAVDQSLLADDGSTVGNVPEPSLQGEGTPTTSVPMQIDGGTCNAIKTPLGVEVGPDSHIGISDMSPEIVSTYDDADTS
ncbi:hypothetical protein LINPERHAP2_LOCUS37365 [Linum perenne]